MARDGCGASLTFNVDPTAKTITGVTLTTATGNTCPTTLPVTVPGTVTSTQGFKTEQIGTSMLPSNYVLEVICIDPLLGSDPMTIWVQMSGSPVTFTLSTPVPL